MQRVIEEMDEERIRELLGDAMVDKVRKVHEELYFHVAKLADRQARVASVNLMAMRMSIDIALHTSEDRISARAVARDIAGDVVVLVDGIKKQSTDREKHQSANLRKTQKE